MVALKAQQAETFLAAPDPRVGAVLLYGPDAGLVSERAAALARKIASRETPPGEILRLDDADLEADPDRLSVELRTLAMFGGRRILRAAAGRRLNAKLVEPLVRDAPLAGFLIVEAGNLKPADALRVLFEKGTAAAAVPCFRDEVKDLSLMVRDVLGAAGLAISADARGLLISRLGADRILSRSELEKLALYAAGKREVTAADVEAITGDVTDTLLDKAPEAAASGDGAGALRDFARITAAGENAQALIAAASRYFLRLHRLRAGLEQGRPFEQVAREIRPPLHFRQQDILARQCRVWTIPRLNEALSAIAEASRTARFAGQAEDIVAERLLLTLAGLARPGS